MSPHLKKVVIAGCLGSLHFGVMLFLFILILRFGTLLNLSGEPLPLWEQVTTGILEVMTCPGRFAESALLDLDAPESALHVLYALNSLLWGVVLMPVVLFLKRRFRRQRPLEPSS